MKKVLLTLVTVVLILSSIFAFTACKKEQAKSDINKNDIGKEVDKDALGDSVVKVDEAMAQDGEAMFLNAVDNFYKTNYTAVYQEGAVDTKVAGQSVIQKVFGLRIRDDGETFMYNNSYTAKGIVDIKVMEKYFVGADGKIKLINADSKKIDIDKETKLLKAKEWNKQQNFNDLKSYLKTNPNDPTKLNMYILNTDTVTKTTKPEKVTKDGKTYYKFNVTCNGKKAFKDYVPVMEYMLKQSAEGKVNPDKTQKLTFAVEIWDTGVFKQYDVVEEYGIDVDMLFTFHGSVKLVSNVVFSYSRKELPFTNYYKDGKFVL